MACLGVAATGVLITGCHWGTLGTVTASPLSYAEQEKAILTLTGIGMPREEAIRKLTEAGIEGTSGISDSVYYCDLWKHDDGANWHLNVALLFDQSGTLYKTRPAQAETGVLTATDLVRDSGDRSTDDVRPREAPADNDEVADRSVRQHEGNVAKESRLEEGWSSYRDRDHRTPFAPDPRR